MKINRYQDISQIDREAFIDYIDRHSAFVHCNDKAKSGEKFNSKCKSRRQILLILMIVDHYIAWVQL